MNFLSIYERGALSIQFLGKPEQGLLRLAQCVHDQSQAVFGRLPPLVMDATPGAPGCSILLQAGASDGRAEVAVDIVVALEATQFLRAQHLLGENTMCLVADTWDEDGMVRPSSPSERARVEQLVQCNKARGYWVPMYDELVDAFAPASGAEAIAMQSVLHNILGMSEVQSHLGLRPLNWAGNGSAGEA